MAIRALIVDDEPLARERIRTLLRDEPDIEIVGECSDGRKAVAAIRKQPLDLLFLDVQMPEMDGFEVLQAVGPDAVPAIIFVTAYDEYALRAFEERALDYLLKPFDRERFRRALERVRIHLQGRQAGEVNQQLRQLIETIRRSPEAAAVPHNGGSDRLMTPADRLVVKSGGRVYFLKIEEIDWIEAAGNYVRLHTSRDSHLVRDTMNNVESRLDTSRFLRIHRSTIVNLERIKELQPWFHGDYVVLLRDGTRLTLSRSYRDRLHEILGRAI